MDNMRVLIADDEKNVREAIAKMVEVYCENAEVIAQASGVASAIKAIEEHKPDVILLDIDLKDGTGFDVISHFQSLNFKVIFITAFQDFAIQAFRFSAVDYILKPANPDLLAAAIEKARSHIEHEKTGIKLNALIHNMQSVSKGSKKIVLNTQETIHVVNVGDIVRLEADRNYTRFFILNHKPILVSGSLIDYEEMLRNYDFFRSHHSHLINLTFVDRFEKKDGGKLIMKDGSEAQVSVRRKDELIAALNRI